MNCSNTIVKDEELFDIRVVIDARHDADTPDDAMSISAVLLAHQLDISRVVLVDHGVVENNVAIG